MYGVVWYSFVTIVLLVWAGLTNSDVVAAQIKNDKAAAARRDVETLQGVWHHASREEKGKVVIGEAKEVLIAFRENVVVFKKGSEVSQVCVLKKIDATADPKTVDLVITDGPNEGMTIQAIYEVKGDFFRYCGGVEVRPTSFMTKADDKGYIYCSSYRRVKPNR